MATQTPDPRPEAVAACLDAISPDARRDDAHELDALFRKVTGYRPQLWGGAMLGYGRYDYTYASGRSGTFLATGFAARKAAFSIFILPGYSDFQPILHRLGTHRKARSCLYVTRLGDVDLDVLGELIRAGLDDLGQTWAVHPE